MKRLTPDARYVDILEAAVAVATSSHYRTMTRAEVAAQAGVSAPLVTHYFQDMAALRYALMDYAVENENDAVVAQGLLDRCPLALKASEEVKTRIKATLPW